MRLQRVHDAHLIPIPDKEGRERGLLGTCCLQDHEGLCGKASMRVSEEMEFGTSVTGLVDRVRCAGTLFLVDPGNRGSFRSDIDTDKPRIAS
jgi:hypothetical protein